MGTRTAVALPLFACLLVTFAGSPARAQAGPGGGGPGGPPQQQALQRMGQMLDLARQSAPEQWPQQKQAMLDRLAGNMKAQNPAGEAALPALLENVEKVLEEARGLSADEFAAQKKSLSMRLVRAVAQGMGRSPGMGGGNPGAGPAPAGAGTDDPPAGARPRTDERPLQKGDPAPDFTLPTLDGAAEVKLSGLFGKRPICLVFGSYT